MMQQELYAVVNDSPMIGYTDRPLLIIDRGLNQAIYNDKERAIQERDDAREEHNNTDINVYKLNVEPIEGGA